ncbi:BTB/POZ domain-containing protein [Tripterygium wilfordii]|uniref:BTB/POZ domain-containing protein n=1 Tax=Tripterygium wilfordii TaxID=458696 RepID=A0A7J7BXT1_TRIWF|nr:BTB/POZ domain-containing protein At1g67900-like [Tripterygium wilfordii]KAF5726720.1 BTB/POZ domain-containing protein [Tripterygium wilfordii]
MKFMKLGSRPDTFYTFEAVRSVSSEVSSDLIIEVKGSRYLLHKFPLLSKCLRLQRLCSESTESSSHQLVQLPDFPGGVEAFELCAKFCYGITITLCAYNIVPARCAAEYLQMTEDVEKGNLIYKIEVFFNSCILQGWKDSIVTLQSTSAFPLSSEDLGITSRCIESIASKVFTHPSKVSLSHSPSRRLRDNVSCNGAESQRHNQAIKGWWAEDIAELGIELYWRTMIAIKSSGRVPSNLIGDALKIYASRWLPNISHIDGSVYKQKVSDSDSDSDSAIKINSKHRLLLESIVSLLPGEKGAVSCSFLLKLIKASNILNDASSSKIELARRVGLQLEEARVSDLLIPSLSYKNDTLYDVDIVLTILEEFMLQGQSPPTSPPRSKLGFERRRSRSAENIDFKLQGSRRSSSASHRSKLKGAKLVDGYLREIARDVNLPLSKFIAVAESIPEFSRLDHDDLYRAIDIYLKAHPDLNKKERKRLCRILDCKKLSMDACMHAAQNEFLPLRVVVQVLFFEQARATMNGGKVTELPSKIKALLAANGIDPSRPTAPLSTTTTSIPADDQRSVSGLKSPYSRTSTLKMKLAEDDDLDMNDMNPDGIGRSSKFKALCAIPTQPKRMFSKLMSVNRNPSEKK